jgi:hypothetical protein
MVELPPNMVGGIDDVKGAVMPAVITPVVYPMDWYTLKASISFTNVSARLFP